MEMEMKRKLGTNTYIRQNRLFKTTTIKRQRGTLHMIKGSIQQEDITIVIEPNIEAPQYIKQILTNIKKEIDSNSNRRGLLIFQLHLMTNKIILK